MARILIVSSSFNAGDAITMMNLFSKWNKSDLFLATPSKTPHIDYFSSCYYLGNKEQEIPLIFRPFIKVADSKVWTFQDNGVKNRISSLPNKLTPRIYKKMVLPILQFLGFYDERFKLMMSVEFKAWIDKINPDIIYSPVSNRIILRFLLLCQKTFPTIKYVFHGFDDWFEPSYKVIFRKKYVTNTETLYRKLISNAHLLLSTTNMMAEEYERRYGKCFKTFHNPVNLSLNSPKIMIKPDNLIHITYIGKIAWHNAKAIINMQKAISMCNQFNHKSVVLDIYSQTSSEDIKHYGIIPDSNLIMHSPVSNNQIMSLLGNSDILFLPITVSKEVAAFTRFSMSTKMGEYLFSGTPIIYCGPEEIAMTKLIKDNKVALYTTLDGPKPLLDLIKVCLNEKLIVKNNIERGIRLSNDLFNLETVSTNFYKLLTK